MSSEREVGGPVYHLMNVALPDHSKYSSRMFLPSKLTGISLFPEFCPNSSKACILIELVSRALAINIYDKMQLG